MVYRQKYEDEKKNVFMIISFIRPLLSFMQRIYYLEFIYLDYAKYIFAFSVYFFRILNLKSFKELQLIVFKCMLHTSYND